MYWRALSHFSTVLDLVEDSPSPPLWLIFKKLRIAPARLQEGRHRPQWSRKVPSPRGFMLNCIMKLLHDWFFVTACSNPLFVVCPGSQNRSPSRAPRSQSPQSPSPSLSPLPSRGRSRSRSRSRSMSRSRSPSRSRSKSVSRSRSRSRSVSRSRTRSRSPLLSSRFAFSLFSLTKKQNTPYDKKM